MEKDTLASTPSPYQCVSLPLATASRLPLTQIDQLRTRLKQNIDQLNTQKYQLGPDNYHQLLNYHHYALTILNNMVNTLQVGQSNQYNQNMCVVAGQQVNQNQIDTINPYSRGLKLVYQPDGRTKVVDTTQCAQRYQAEWERQFDENLINPPMYSVPPNNQFVIKNQNNPSFV